MSNMLEIRGLKKSFGGIDVLDIPELSIEKGGRCALIGANGSGKTTLLRILAGVLAPDEGKVRIMTDKVSYMPQKPYFFDFSVEKNIALAVRDRKNAKARANAALSALGLESIAARRGSSLSGGEAQRMAFARVLAERNELILLDEPTAAADLIGCERMEKALDSLVAESGATLVFATHTPAQALKLAREVIVLDKGRVAEHGEVRQLLYSPRSECAKSFLSHWRL